jgi:hypothetical protein
MYTKIIFLLILALFASFDDDANETAQKSFYMNTLGIHYGTGLGGLDLSKNINIVVPY